MSLAISDEALLGYIESILVKSPRIDVIAENLLQEDMDISMAIAKNLISGDYARLMNIRDVDELEENLFKLYDDLKKDVSRYLRESYRRYLDTVYELYDIDKIVAIASTLKHRRTVITSKYSLSNLSSLIEWLSMKRGDISMFSDYIKCVDTISIECFYRSYLERVEKVLVGIRSEKKMLFDYSKSMLALSLLALGRFYEYNLNCRYLKTCLEMAMERVVSREYYKQISGLYDKVFGPIQQCLFKDPSMYSICEALYIYRAIRDILFIPSSIVDVITMLFIHKYYEYRLIRYLAMKICR